jgi:hypothetical protein
VIDAGMRRVRIIGKLNSDADGMVTLYEGVDPDTLEQPAGYGAERLSPPATSQADHLELCPCGAWIDKRDLGEVFRHAGEHERPVTQ